MYNRCVQSDTSTDPTLSDTAAESPVADVVPPENKLLPEATNVELELMRQRLAAQFDPSKDPYERRILKEPGPSAKRWVGMGFALAALFLMAYIFVYVMRDAIQSQPVTAGLEEDVLQGEDEVDANTAPRVEVQVTTSPN